MPLEGDIGKSLDDHHSGKRLQQPSTQTAAQEEMQNMIGNIFISK